MIQQDLLSCFNNAFNANPLPPAESSAIDEVVALSFCQDFIDACANSLEAAQTVTIYSGVAAGATVTATVTTVTSHITATTKQAVVSSLYAQVRNITSQAEWVSIMLSQMTSLISGCVVSESISGTGIVPGVPPTTIPIVSMASGTLIPQVGTFAAGLASIHQVAQSAQTSVEAVNLYVSALSPLLITLFSSSQAMMSSTTLPGLVGTGMIQGVM